MLDFVGLPVYKEFMDYIREVDSVKKVSAAELRDHYGSVKRVISDQINKWKTKTGLCQSSRNRLQRCNGYFWIQTGTW